MKQESRKRGKQKTKPKNEAKRGRVAAGECNMEIQNETEITSLLNDSDPAKQLKGISQAVDNRSYFHILQILRLLQSTSKEVSKEAFNALIILAEECLLPENRDLPETVKYAAVKVIHKLDSKFIAHQNNEVNSGQADRAIKALMILKHFVEKPQAKAMLKRFLKHPDKRVRATVVLHMGCIASRAEIDDLAGFLSDCDDRVKANAVEVVEELNEPRFIRVINKFRTDENNRVRANALKCLFKLGEQNIGDDIKFMLMDPESKMRASALWLLGEVCAFAPHLESLVKLVEEDEDALVRKNFERLNFTTCNTKNKASGQNTPASNEPEKSDLAEKAPPELLYDEMRTNDYCALKLSGIVTGRTLPAFKNRLDQILKTETRIILDCTDVQYIDRLGATLIQDYHGLLQAKEGFLFLFGCRPTVMELLQLVQGNEKLSMFPRLEDIHNFLGVSVKPR